MRTLISICLCLMVLGLTATDSYAAKMAPQATPADQMPTAGQKPEAAKIKELLKEGKNFEDSGWTLRAIRPYQEALKLSETAMGPEHPLTVYSELSLGLLYQEAGRLAEAEPWLTKGLEVGRRVLGTAYLGHAEYYAQQ